MNIQRIAVEAGEEDASLNGANEHWRELRSIDLRANLASRLPATDDMRDDATQGVHRGAGMGM